MKKALSLLLVLAFLLSLAPAALAYSQAYGAEVWLQDTLIDDYAVYSDNIYWSDYYSKLRQEHYITFDPTGLAVVASYGQSVSQLTYLSDAVADYESKGYRVVGAINGDFYDTASGYPLGLLISGGELLSGSANYFAAGFRADGSVLLGKPDLSITVRRRFNQTVEAVSINKPRVEEGGMTLLTYDFRTDHTTGTTTEGITALCTVSSGTAAIGSSMSLHVSEITEDARSITLQPGQVVLTVAANGSEEAREFLSTLRPGETVTVSFSAAEGWETVTEAVGALYQLVENGEPLSSGFPSGQAPRSAVGVKADGQVVFYTVDGRQTGYSMGSGMKVLAQRMAELGCVTALCLDGGGSTALAAATPDRTSTAIVSSPSDGKERKVSNHLLLLAPGYTTGIAGHIYLSSPVQAVLPGSTVELTAKLVDTAYRPMRNQVMLSASAGEIVGNTFIAPDTPGPVTITATAAGRYASVEIMVVGEADELILNWDYTTAKDGQELILFPGDKAHLGASAVYNRLTLDASNSDFSWTVDPALGTYDPETGILTTTFKEAAGTVNLSFGSRSITVNVVLDAESPFADTDGHWGGAYMASLYHKGILTGVQQGEDLLALPNKGVTRAEFAVLLARYLGIITSDYAEVEVPFTDMDKVGAWAQDAVRAMYALGIVGGIQHADGSVTFDPAGSLSRAQAVTMMGRAIEAEASADLSEFTDANQIPSYAREHFETLVALGVVGGSYGKLDPAGVMTRAAICKVLTVMP